MSSERVRVVHYVSGFAESSGGIETVLYNIFEQFRWDNSYEMILLTRNAYIDTEFYAKFCLLEADVISLDIKHLNPKNFRTFYRQLFLSLQKTQPDILHIHGTDEPFVTAAARRAGIRKIILHAHTPGIELNGRPLLYKYMRMVSGKLNMIRADRLVACSEDTGKQIFGKRKFEVINNGVNVEVYRFDAQKRQEKRDDLEIKGTVIGHVGRFSEVKNHTFIIDIFKKYLEIDNTAKLLLAGTGQLLGEIQKLTQEKDIDKNVIFAGESLDIPQLLSAMDCFLMPSKYEGLGIVLIEAQAAGLPCIVSDKIPRDVQITDLIYTKSLNLPPEKWASDIQNILAGKFNSNRKQYADIVGNSRFNVSNVYDQLKELYKSK